MLDRVGAGVATVASARKAAGKLENLLASAAGVLARSRAEAHGVGEPLPARALGSVSLKADAAAKVTGTKNAAAVLTPLDGVLNLGKTLTITVGATTSTITFGLLGQVNNAAQLEQRIDAVVGVEGSYDANGYLVITGEDADTTFTIGGTYDTAGKLGIAKQTYNPTNLLTQGLTAGQTLTFQVASGAVQTITFGKGAGEVSTRAEFDAALASLSGVTATVNGDQRLGFVGLRGPDSITLGGTANTQAVFGLAKQTYLPTPTEAPSAERAGLEAVFNRLVGEIDGIVTSATVGSTNLLDGDSLEVRYDSGAGGTVQLQGGSLRASALGLSGASVGDFQSDAALDALAGQITTALAAVRGVSSGLEAQDAVVSSRETFLRSLIGLLNQAGDDLTLVNHDAESAALAALRLRSDLSSEALKNPASTTPSLIAIGHDALRSPLFEQGDLWLDDALQVGGPVLEDRLLASDRTGSAVLLYDAMFGQKPTVSIKA